jgi:tetraacyldisaccharide 4'-kinase
VVKTRSFPDHHRFSAREAADLISTAARENLALITTEKDLARMRGDPALAALEQASKALPVTLVFDDENMVQRHAIDSLLGKAFARPTVENGPT